MIEYEFKMTLRYNFYYGEHKQYLLLTKRPKEIGKIVTFFVVAPFIVYIHDKGLKENRQS